MRKQLFVLAAVAAIASAVFASLASAADHRDSPLTMGNATADINDIYAFRSPTNADNLVVAITVNPFIAPADNATRGVLDSLVSYQIHIDRDGNLVDDATVNIRKAGNSLVIEGLGTPIAAPITPAGAAPIITTSGQVKVFAGLRDDPFFFDIPGFQGFLGNQMLPVNGLRPAGGGNPIDAFAGVNIMSIVIELPATVVTGGTSATSGTFKTWVSTNRGGQVDRMGIPLINAALMPPGPMKDAFNAGNPLTDAASFRATAIGSIERLRGIADGIFGPNQSGGPLGSLTAAEVGAALVPDIVSIDLSQPVQFPNGRRLQDDVVDLALGLVLNRGGAAGVSDGINANDKPFLATFPFLAEAHTAAAGGAAPISPPSTGDGGLLSPGTSWALAAAFLALAAVLAGSATVVTVRSRGR